MEESKQPNTVTYWESRQINIGDYENIAFGATFGVKFVDINVKEKKAQISHSAGVEIYPSMTFETAFETAQLTVKSVLDAREKDIRLRTNQSGSTGFDTLQKGIDLGVIKPEEKPAGITKIEDEIPVKSKKNTFSDDDFDLGDFELDEEPKPKKAKNKEEPKKKSGFVLKSSNNGIKKNDFPPPPEFNADEEIPF